MQPDISRCELHHLSIKRIFEFITKMCEKVNVTDRILEDLKKSALFRDLPRSPMLAILLARLLNESQQEIPSNMTELYAKYLELILGRWDEKKGLQSQKEYQALDNILMRLARQMIDDQRLFISVDEVKAAFKDYLDQRNLEIDADQLFNKMVDRCEIVLLDSNTETFGFKHRSFTEFFYAKSFIPDQSLVVDSRVFNVYWINTFFFYLGLRKDCPNDLQAIFKMPAGSELEEWLKIYDRLQLSIGGIYDAVPGGCGRRTERSSDGGGALSKDCHARLGDVVQQPTADAPALPPPDVHQGRLLVSVLRQGH